MAVGQLDSAGSPEIISVDFASHTMTIWRVDATAPNSRVIVRSIDLFELPARQIRCCQLNPGAPGCNSGGGAPVVADFTGDGVPDVGVATGFSYQVYDGVKLMDSTVATGATVAWTMPILDCSSAQTGAAAFDLDNDGVAEALFADENTFRIYNGTNGDVHFATCNTSATIREKPVVADVDGDGFAEIVVVSNRYSSINCGGQKTTGVRVFGAQTGHWARAARTSGAGLIGAPNAAPDLTLEVSVEREPELKALARVRNLGDAPVPAGITVSFYDGDPQQSGTRIGQVDTTRALAVLGSTMVELALPSEPVELFAVVNDGAEQAWKECRMDNNVVGPVGFR
ncbi:MAG: VCBS repeat-containing protein [bacterium]